MLVMRFIDEGVVGGPPCCRVSGGLLIRRSQVQTLHTAPTSMINLSREQGLNSARMTQDCCIELSLEFGVGLNDGLAYSRSEGNANQIKITLHTAPIST